MSPVQSAAPWAMTAAALNASEPAGMTSRYLGDVERQRQASLTEKVEYLAELRATGTWHEEHKRLVSSTAEAFWRCKGPQVPMGISGPALVERPRVLLQQKEKDQRKEHRAMEVVQKMVYPQTQSQAQDIGPLLALGATGKKPSSNLGSAYTTGSLAMRVKPNRTISSFGEVYLEANGVHPYYAEPFSTGQWKL